MNTPPFVFCRYGLILAILATLGLTACGGRDADARKQLQEAGYQLSDQGFLQASQRGDLPAIRSFLELEQGQEARGERNQSALMLAARHGHREVVETLLQNGAEIGAQDADGQTALFHAIAGGHSQIVHDLVQAGADLAQRDAKGYRPLTLAAYYGQPQVVEELAPRSLAFLDDALFIASLQGHVGAIDVLTNYGASVYARMDDGRTPLMVAAQEGREEAVWSLLQNGANVYATDERGTTAAELAGQAGYKNLETLLNKPPSEESFRLPNEEEVEKQLLAMLESEAAGIPAELQQWAEDGTKDGTHATHQPTASHQPPDAQTTTKANPDRPPHSTTAQAARPPRPRTNPSAENQLAAKHPNPASPPKAPSGRPYSLSLRAGPQIQVTGAKQAKDLVLIRYAAKPLPLLVEGVTEQTAHVRMLYGGQERLQLQVGDPIPNTSLVVRDVQPRYDHSKLQNGKPLDVSVVEFQDRDTSQSRQAITGITATAHDPMVGLRDQVDGRLYVVREGSQITLANDQNLRVLDIRPTQVIVEGENGETMTIRRHN